MEPTASYTLITVYPLMHVLEMDQHVLSCSAQECRFDSTVKSQRTLSIICMQCGFMLIFFLCCW